MNLRLVNVIAAMVMLAGCGQDQPSQVVEDGSVPSGTYAIDKDHTYITFSYMHQGLSYPLLRATSVDGELNLDMDAMQNSTVSVAVDVDSIRTNMDFFDEELASRKFFFADRYPHITFTTHRYEAKSDSTGTLTGFITIRNITRPLVLDVNFNGAMNHPFMDVPVIGFSASGALNRADFDLDRFVPLISNKVNISIQAEFLQGSNDGSAAAARTAMDATANADPASLEIVAGTGE